MSLLSINPEVTTLKTVEKGVGRIEIEGILNEVVQHDDNILFEVSCSCSDDGIHDI